MSKSNNIDCRLQHLVLEIQKLPPQSRSRHRKFAQLCRELRQSQKLIHPHINACYAGAYAEIYDVALQRLFCDLHRQIDRYNPDRGAVLAWVNYLLKVRFSEAVNEVMLVGRGDRFHPARRVTWQDWHNESLSDPRSHRGDDLAPDITDVRDYIHADPHQILRQVTLHNAPQISFQWLLLHYLDGYAWQELAEAIAIPLPTLNSFFHRTLKRLLPQLRQGIIPEIRISTA
ncbi:MAG: hypothetical protein AAGG51_09055 [Cyanobacteria bacterium P01_G01_bin.54]